MLCYSRCYYSIGKHLGRSRILGMLMLILQKAQRTKFWSFWSRKQVAKYHGSPSGPSLIKSVLQSWRCIANWRNFKKRMELSCTSMIVCSSISSCWDKEWHRTNVYISYHIIRCIAESHPAFGSSRIFTNNSRKRMQLHKIWTKAASFLLSCTSEWRRGISVVLVLL